MKLTPWFDCRGTTPARPGVYQHCDGPGGLIGYRHWNGREWGGWGGTVGVAWQLRHWHILSASWRGQWRGILK